MDEQTIKRIIQEALAEMGEDGCNTPIVKTNTTMFPMDDVVEPSIPGWSVVFSCNAADVDKRRSVKFEIETPDGRSEREIKQEILAKLKLQLA